MSTARNQQKDHFAASRTQTAFQTRMDNLISGDCFAVQSMNLRGIVNEEMFSDHTGRMVLTSSTVNAGAAEWDAVYQIRPRGTAAGAADWAPHVANGIFNSAAIYANSALCSGVLTVLSANISNASGLSAGMMIPIETSGSTSVYNPRLLVSVSAGTSGGSGGNITWRPALTAAPGTGARIMPSRTYALLNSACDTSFTNQTWGTNISRKTWGSFVNTFTVNLGNNTPPTMQLDGGARGYAQAGPTSLASAITVATGTNLALTDPDQVDAGFVVVIGTEHISLTTKNIDDTFTMATSARGLNGTVATSHLANVGVTLYKPTPTLNGRPIPPQYCVVDVGGKSAASSTIERLEGTDATFTIGDGIVPDEQLFGDEWTVPSLGLSDGQMTPQLQVTSKLDNDKMRYWNEARDGDQVGAIVRCGRLTGRMFAIGVPYALVRNTEQSEGDGQGSTPVTITFEARGARSGLDAVYFMTG